MQNVKLATSVLVLSVALGITATAAPAAGSHAHAAKGGTLNVDLFTDTDYTDPALDYYAPGWELEYATALKLMNYADKTGTRELPDHSRSRGRLPEDLGERQRLRLHRQGRLHEVLERRGRDARELRARDQPARKPASECQARRAWSPVRRAAVCRAVDFHRSIAGPREVHVPDCAGILKELERIPVDVLEHETPRIWPVGLFGEGNADGA